MDRHAILDKLTAVFRDIFDDDTIVISLETTAKDIEEWDSANHINIIVATEALFGIRFKSAEIEELHNVGEFVALIERKLSK